MAWCMDILMSIQEHTPMGWSSTTLQYFPSSLAEFFREKAPPPENKVQLRSTVDTEYSKWKSECRSPCGPEPSATRRTGHICR